MHSRHLMKPLMMLSNLKQIAIAKSIIGLAQRKKNVRYVMSGSLAPYVQGIGDVGGFEKLKLNNR